MADNRNLAALSGNCAADEATYSGDTAVIQLVKPVFVTGSEGSKTVAALEAGGGTEATALRVTLASDSTGVVSVDDNGGSLTVDGTVTANLSATDNAVLDDIAAQALAIKTAVEILDNTVAGSEMQVDIVSSALPTGAATLAEQQTQTTALQLIDDTVATLGTTTYTEATTKGLIIGAVRRDADTTLANTTNEVTPLQVDANGYLKVECFSGATLPVSLTSISASVVPGTAATNLGKAEDAAHTTGDTGVMSLGVRAATPTDRSAGSTDGDYEPFAVNASGAVWVTQTPTTTGGLSTFRSIDIDETEEEIKATAGQVFGWYLTNLATTRRYIKFYNATAASVTVGSTTPFLTIPLDAGQSANVEFTNGIAFSTAISVAATNLLADNDATAPGANEVVGNIFYK